MNKIEIEEETHIDGKIYIKRHYTSRQEANEIIKLKNYSRYLQIITPEDKTDFGTSVWTCCQA